jgi:hypothetical protein
MRQQLPNGREMFSENSESWQETIDAIVDPNFSLACEQHHRQRRRQRLGQGREIKHGTRLKRGFLRKQGAKAERLLECHPFVLRRQHHGAGKNSLINGFAKRSFNLTKIHKFTLVQSPARSTDHGGGASSSLNAIKGWHAKSSAQHELRETY